MVKLDRNSILAANDAKHEPVECPEWGGTVYVRTISAAERDRWEIEHEKRKDSPGATNIRGMLLSLALCDEHGKAMFTIADADALGKKSAVVMDRLFDAAAKLNGIGAAATEAAKKNCNGANGDGSP